MVSHRRIFYTRRRFFKLCRQKFLFLCNISLFFIILIIKQLVTTICANTVAIAAPATPKAGILPIPNIKIGSSIILVINPKVLITLQNFTLGNFCGLRVCAVNPFDFV